MKHELEIRKVLIVDDEPDIRDILARTMRSLNIESDQASNGIEALELLRKNQYHAVLCDIMMPGMTGLDCLAQAQTDGLSVPFVFITGYEDRDRMLQAIRLGALDFISKPFDNDELVDVVFRVIEIGLRRNRIYREIADADLGLLQKIKRSEKTISLMRAHNNRKRAA